jgi:Tfp pilus assembly PilM family ATPase
MKPTARKAGWLAAQPPTSAIEIASRRVTVAELSADRGEPVIAAYASETLPPDAVVPALVGVNIATPSIVGDALRRAFDRAGIRPPRRAALIVPDSIARVSLLSFEQLPARAADLDQVVHWQIKKATPFPLEEARVSYEVLHAEPGSHSVLATVARQDVIAQYEAVTDALGIHAGVVDLASFNIVNAVIAAGAHTPGDWLLVSLAPEATTLAIVRGQQLMFYRHRAAVEEPLAALVHQTAMYHQDRLAGSTFSKVWLAGTTLTDNDAERARREVTDLLGVHAETVDIRSAAALRDRITAAPDVLDALAAPVGVLLRERKAA